MDQLIEASGVANQIVAIPMNVIVAFIYGVATIFCTTLGSAVAITYKVAKRTLQHPTWDDLKKESETLKSENLRVQDEMARRYQDEMERCTNENAKRNEQVAGYLQKQSKEIAQLSGSVNLLTVGVKFLLPIDKQHILDKPQ